MPLVEFSWMNIDSLYIQGDHINYGYESMDNLSYSVLAVQPAVWLFGSAPCLMSVTRVRNDRVSTN